MSNAVGATVRIKPDFAKVERAEKAARFKNLWQASAFVRTTAIRSMRVSPKAGPAGSPPRTRRLKILRRAIRFVVERDVGRSTIGPDAAVAGDVGGAHEHSGMYRGNYFPKRAFMGPALDKSRSKFPKQWEGTIGPG